MTDRYFALYDAAIVELSENFIDALKKVMAAEVVMMREQDSDSADCWYWGRCTIGDLSNAHALAFQYGPEDDMPTDDFGRFGVMIE